MSQPFHPSNYEQPRDWWVRQAEIERDGRQRADIEAGHARSVGEWGRECALVALRMLARAGKLKATTDDERKVVEWAQREPRFGVPPAQRRLGSPFDDAYEQTADAAAQTVLFDGEAAA